jgi:SecD/SecF fusion protein
MRDLLRCLWQSVAVLCGAMALCGCSPRPPSHGTAFTVQFTTNAAESATNQAPSLADIQKVMRKRLKSVGVRSYVELAGPDRILVKIPRLPTNELAHVRQVLSRAGKLEFRMVHPQSDQLIADNIPEPGYEVLRFSPKSRASKPLLVSYLVKKKPERGLTGAHIRMAMVTRHYVTKEPEIQFELDEQGKQLFAQITREYAPKGNTFYQLAIVFDGQLYSAPRINEPIESGRGMISGGFEMQEALALATLLENPFDTPVRILEEKSF